MQLHAFVVLRFVQADIDPPLKRKEVTKEAEKEAGCNKPEAQKPRSNPKPPPSKPNAKKQTTGCVSVCIYTVCIYTYIYIHILEV